jgi:hypothetical protein
MYYAAHLTEAADLGAKGILNCYFYSIFMVFPIPEGLLNITLAEFCCVLHRNVERIEQ